MSKTTAPKKEKSSSGSWLGRFIMKSIVFCAGIGLCGALLVAMAIGLTWPNLPDLQAMTDYRPRIPLRIYSEDKVLLAEYGEESILLTGDAFPGDIVKGIGRIIPAGEKLPLTAFKVPHHGSRNNNSNELFEAFNCHSFMVSTNGRKHGHPDREGIARILIHSAGDTALYFNYSHDAGTVWSNDRLQNDYGYKAFFAGNGHMKIDLAE